MGDIFPMGNVCLSAKLVQNALWTMLARYEVFYLNFFFDCPTLDKYHVHTLAHPFNSQTRFFVSQSSGNAASTSMPISDSHGHCQLHIKLRTAILYEVLIFPCTSAETLCIYVRCFLIRELNNQLYVEESSGNDYAPLSFSTGRHQKLVSPS